MIRSLLSTGVNGSMAMRMDEQWWRVIFWSALVLGVIDRIRLLAVFGFSCTGMDDALIWEMARDYGQGIFREPYMYGQNYNPMLEALVGAPFVRLFGHVWIVMPIVTSVLGLLPYWSFAFWRARKKEFPAATAFAAMPLLLSSEWGILTTETRGFVHGIALLALLPVTLSLHNDRLRFLLTSLVMSTALLCNPNALFLIVPIGLMLLLQHGRSFGFWLAMGIGALPAAAFWRYFRGFFDTHPWDLNHSIDAAEMVFGPALILQAFGRLDSHFNGMSPIWWPNGHVILWLLIGAVVLLLSAGRRQHAWAVVAALAMMIVAFGIPKVHDGCDSMFYPRSRMFLVTPLLFAWALAEYLGGRSLTSPRWRWLLVAMALPVIWKWYALPNAVEHALTTQDKAFVREERLSDIRSRCEAIAHAARGAEAIVVVPIRWPWIKVDHKAHFRAYFDCYACPSLVNDFPPTYGPVYDRRSWVKHAYFTALPGSTLFVGGSPEGWAKTAGSARIVDRSVPGGVLLHEVMCGSMSIDNTITHFGLAEPGR